MVHDSHLARADFPADGGDAGCNFLVIPGLAWSPRRRWRRRANRDGLGYVNFLDQGSAISAVLSSAAARDS